MGIEGIEKIEDGWHGRSRTSCSSAVRKARCSMRCQPVDGVHDADVDEVFLKKNRDARPGDRGLTALTGLQVMRRTVEA